MPGVGALASVRDVCAAGGPPPVVGVLAPMRDVSAVKISRFMARRRPQYCDKATKLRPSPALTSAREFYRAALAHTSASLYD